MTGRKTRDGLPVVAEETFSKFVREYPLSSPNNNPAVTRRIRAENPQIYRILKLGMQATPNFAARAYYECGIQVVYELLRVQSAEDSAGRKS